jgi:hypothetical protein
MPGYSSRSTYLRLQFPIVALDDLALDLQVEARDRPVLDVGDEDLGPIPVVIQRQVPGAVDVNESGDGLHDVTRAVQDQDR